MFSNPLAGNMDKLDVLRDLSEEEKQAIASQRERSEKISSLMGQCLLKGWRMLEESCPKCGTILFLPRSGNKYCVACSEVDVPTSEPSATSEKKTKEAAKNGPIEEAQFRLPSAGKCKVMQGHRGNRKAEHVEYRSSESRIDNTAPIVTELREKLRWCTSRLSETQTAEEIGQWAEAIRCLAEAADAVHKCSVPLV